MWIASLIRQWQDEQRSILHRALLPDPEPPREPVIGGYRDPALVRVDSPEEPPPFKVDPILFIGFFYFTLCGLDALHRDAIGTAGLAWLLCVAIVVSEVSRWRNHNT